MTSNDNDLITKEDALLCLTGDYLADRDYPPEELLSVYIRRIKKLAPVDAIPREEVKQFILSIQQIKDRHNEFNAPINYGTICGILIAGYRLLDKYKENDNV